MVDIQIEFFKITSDLKKVTAAALIVHEPNIPIKINILIFINLKFFFKNKVILINNEQKQSLRLQFGGNLPVTFRKPEVIYFLNSRVLDFLRKNNNFQPTTRKSETVA